MVMCLLEAHPTSEIDGNAGIMRVSEEFLGSCGALETASIPLEGLKSLKIPTNVRYQWLSRWSRGSLRSTVK